MRRLHEELKEMDKANSHTSYISAWWFEEYLANRQPLPINMSPYLVFRDDPTPGRHDPAIRAAGFVAAALAFKQQLDSEKLLPEVFEFSPPQYTQSEWFKRMVALCPSRFVTLPYLAVCAGCLCSFVS